MEEFSSPTHLFSLYDLSNSNFVDVEPLENPDSNFCMTEVYSKKNRVHLVCACSWHVAGYTGSYAVLYPQKPLVIIRAMEHLHFWQLPAGTLMKQSSLSLRYDYLVDNVLNVFIACLLIWIQPRRFCHYESIFH